MYKDKYKTQNNQTWVYLIKDLDTGYYKIGYSKQPVKRLTQLRKQPTLLPKPNRFTLTEAWIGSIDDERYLHNWFDDVQVRGEWFALSNNHIDALRCYFVDRVSLIRNNKKPDYLQISVEDYQNPNSEFNQTNLKNRFVTHFQVAYTKDEQGGVYVG